MWAIQDWGFDAVIAPSFGDIFKNNCVNVGLLAVELADEDIARLQDIAQDPNASIRVDLETQVVEAGEFVFEFSIDPAVKDRLMQGLDRIGLTLQEDAAISDFEARRPAWL